MQFPNFRRALAVGVAIALTVSVMSVLPSISTRAHAAETAPASCEVQIHPTVDSAGFTHPGIGLTAEVLENARSQISVGEQPWTSYYEQMKTSSAAAVAVTSSNASATDPTKPTSVAFNSQSIESRFIADGLKVYTQSLMYYFTGQEVYRSNALTILRVWEQMDPAQYAMYTDAHIHTGIPLNRMLTGAEILRYSSCADESAPWTADDTSKLTTNLINPVIETFQHDQNHFMNQHLYPLLGAMAGYIFTGNRSRYDEAVEWFTVNSTATNQGFNGSIERLFRMVDTNDKTGQPIADPHVQQVEMGRDQAHGGGDLTNAYYLARMMMAQGTRVDPVLGTVSTSDNAVGPYEFLGDRILAAADYFWKFMLGFDPEWTPVAYSISPDGTIRDTYDHISDSYRGRYTTASFWDLYYYYTYTKHEDLSTTAPYYAEAFAKRLPLTYDYGGKASNAWDGPDGGGDFWLYIPAAAAGSSTPNPQASATVLDLEDRYTNIEGQVSEGEDGSTGYVRLLASGSGSKIAYLSGSTSSKSISFRIRTDGSATMRLTADTLAETVVLPDTGGQWREFTVDLGVSESLGDLFYITATGSGAHVDLDSMNIAPASSSTVPNYASTAVHIVGYAGAAISADLSTQYSGSAALTYSATGLPSGAHLDPATGVLDWTPAAAATAHVVVAATDGTATAAETVTVSIAPDRDGALTMAQQGHEADAVYEAASQSMFNSALSQAQKERDNGSDASYLGALSDLVAAVDGLKLESPRLADGSLDYSSLLSSSSAGTSVYSLTDDSNQTGTSYGTAVGLAQIFNFGPFARVSASRFGLQSNIFEDRLANSAVFGSNDGISWTRLTPDVTTMTQDYQTLDVAPALQDQRFQFVKVQMLNALPDVLYGTINNLFEMTEFHIYGDRHATVGDLDQVTIAAPSSVNGRVTPGSTVQLNFHASESISDPHVTIGGSAVAAVSDDGQTWTATVPLPSSAPVGQQLPFAIDYTTHSGVAADTVETTSDGSKLYSSTDVGLVDSVLAGTQVVGEDGQVSSTVTADAAHLFDGNASTYSDTRLVNGRASLVWDLGEGAAMSISGVDLLVRQDQYGTSRPSTLRFEGSVDGTVWVPMTSTVKSTPDWQRLTPVTDTAYRFIRLTNGNIMDVAEVRVIGSYSPPVTNITSLSISSSNSLGNYAVDGDIVTVDIVLSDAPRSISATIDGHDVTLVPVGSATHLRGSATVSVGSRVGQDLAFTVDHVTADGRNAVTATKTTDRSYVRMGTTTGLIVDLPAQATAVKLDGSPDTSTTSQPKNLFDGNLTTATDTRVVNGTADIVFDFAASHAVSLDRVELALRQDSYGISRLKNMSLMGSDDLTNWTVLVNGVQPTLAWQGLALTDSALKSRAFRYLRLSNGNIMGVAELRLYGAIISPVTSIAPVTVETWTNEEPELPSTVEATRADGSRDSLPVIWSLPPDSQWTVPGIVTVTGTVTGTSVAATATVTVRTDGSTTAPAKGILSTDNGWDTGLHDGSYHVTMNIWWGENARRVILLENGRAIEEKDSDLNSPQAQATVFTIAGRPNGSYVYTARLVNSSGTTLTNSLTVAVTDANPAKPVLSADDRDGDGNYTVTANLWWGTNATSYEFFEDGVSIATGTLPAATPNAQKASVDLTGRPSGIHRYTVAFTNAAGTTRSDELDVRVND